MTGETKPQEYEMKITKRQLTRIIKEEKKKLQEQQSPADRAMGLYADMSSMTNAEAAMEQFMEGVINSAAEDLGVGEDDNEAFEYGRLALIELFANFAGNYGFVELERSIRSVDELSRSSY
jgi:hypothetical protein